MPPGKTKMKITSDLRQGITVIPNSFIDGYMSRANGEFVKVFLLLLRYCQAGTEFSLSLASDALECTEKDIQRAISYWERMQLLSVTPDQSGQPAAIRLNLPDARQENVPQEAPEPASAPTRDRMRALSGQEDIRQMFFVADQYMKRPLSSSEQEELLYYYDTLGFSSDLIVYLLEYCISKGSASRHYMRKVALAWHEKNIRTVQEAQQESSLYHKDYYTVMNAFGIRRRDPSPAEQQMITYWLTDLGFTMDVVLEACKRTVMQTHEPSFQYAGKILEQWKKQNVRSLQDIGALDEAHQARQKTQAGKKEPAAGTGSGNRFNNYTQREYDYQDLERRLLENGASQ